MINAHTPGGDRSIVLPSRPIMRPGHPVGMHGRMRLTLVQTLRAMGLIDATCVLATDPLDTIAAGTLTPSVGPAMTVTGSMPVVASAIPGVPAWSMDGFSCAIQTTGTTDLADTDDGVLLALVYPYAAPWTGSGAYFLASKGASVGIGLLERWDAGVPAYGVAQDSLGATYSTSGLAMSRIPLLMSARVCRTTGKIQTQCNTTAGTAAALPAGTLDGNQPLAIGSLGTGSTRAKAGTQILGAAVFFGAGICDTVWSTTLLSQIYARVV